jgi:predicted esterase
VEELADIFRAANADLTLHWEKSGHILSQGDVLMAFDWIRRFYVSKHPEAK